MEAYDDNAETKKEDNIQDRLKLFKEKGAELFSGLLKPLDQGTELISRNVS